jgi:DNA-binding NarL/FixJ family response regulator
MPGQDGLAVLQEMHQAHYPTRVVLLTVGLEEPQALEAIRLGAQGVALKEMASHLLVQCVRKVHARGQWLERHSVNDSGAALVRPRERPHPCALPAGV